MTREEQIDWLCRLRADLNNGVIFTPWNKEFIEALNDALEQEPCDNAVSRQAVLDAMYELCNKGGTLKENPWRDNPHIDAITDAINNLPSVNPQEPKYCDRNICVSNEYNGIGCDECEVTKSQEPKTGHWIHRTQDGGCFWEECSVCHTERAFSTKYCPDCGTYMYADIR